MSRRRRTRVALMVIAAGSLAAHPPSEGTESTVGFGAGSFESVSGSPSYRADLIEGLVYGEVRHRLSTGLTAAGSLELAPGAVTSRTQLDPAQAGPYDPPKLDVGDVHFGVQAALRGGWHGDWLGAELGVAVVRASDWSLVGPLAPSGLAWLGAPDWVYGWAQLHRGPAGHSGPSAGIGHRGQWALVRLGVAPEPEGGLGLLAAVQVRSKPGLMLGPAFLRGSTHARQRRPNVHGMVLSTTDHGVAGD